MFANPGNEKIADLFDVLSINRYNGWYIDTGDLASAEPLEAELRGWAATFGKPIVMSEYIADTQPGLHSVWDVAWTEEYQSALLAMYHRLFDRIPERSASAATRVGSWSSPARRCAVSTARRSPRVPAPQCSSRTSTDPASSSPRVLAHAPITSCPPDSSTPSSWPSNRCYRTSPGSPSPRRTPPVRLRPPLRYGHRPRDVPRVPLQQGPVLARRGRRPRRQGAGDDLTSPRGRRHRPCRARPHPGAP